MARRSGLFFPIRPVHEAAKRRLGQQYYVLFVGSILTGLLGSGAAILLHHAVDWAATLFFHPSAFLGGGWSAIHGSDELHRTAPWWLVLFAPALGGLLVGIIATRIAAEVRYSGIPYIMTATTVGEGRIRRRVAPWKILAASATLGSGGSGGKEGPIAYIGAALGSLAGRVTGLSQHDQKILIASGASAGIAAIFNAPLGGVMFGVELFLTEFSTRAFIPIVVATVIATVLTFLVLGEPLPYGEPLYTLASPYELALYLALGLVAALVAVALIQALHGVDLLAGRFRGPGFLLPALGGLATGAVGLLLLASIGDPMVLGTGRETVRGILESSPEATILLLVLVAKLAATAFTYSTGGAAGLFGPSLFLGAALGGAFGGLVQGIDAFPVGPPGAYAIVGMAAVFAGASRATFAAILIVFEITRTYEIILPLMFACVASDALAVALTKHTLYTRKLERAGIYFQYDREVNPLQTLLCGEVATTNVFTVRSDETVDDVLRRTTRSTHRAFPVIDPKTHRLVGIVTRSGLQGAATQRRGRERIARIMERDVITVRSDEPVSLAAELLTDHEIGRIPVVSPREPDRLVGILSRTDVLWAYQRQRRRLRGEERPGR